MGARRGATPPAAQLALFDDAAAAAPSTPSAPSAPPVPAEFRHPSAQREIELGGHRIGYALQRSRRRSIGFVVAADGLRVSAPRWVGAAEIDAALRAKSRWIVAKLHEQRDRARRAEGARVAWRDGVTIPFLGVPLRVVLDPLATGAVLHADDGGDRRLVIGLPLTAAPQQVRDAVKGWLQRQARWIFDERCAVYAPRLGVQPRRLSLSSATTRWGSASADGSIRLHWRLLHFPLPVVDYVVVHELAHLREMNHGAAFWAIVRRALPDHEAARAALRSAVPPAYD